MPEQLDLTRLPKRVVAYIEEVAVRSQELETRARRHEEHAKRLEIEVKHLRKLLRLELIEKYGAASEGLSDVQLGLFEEEPGVAPKEVQIEAQAPESEKQVAPKGRGHASLPAELPREEVIIKACEADCVCPQCQGERKVIGYETSERLHRIPARYVVRVLKREKLACPTCEESGVVCAPLPAQIIPKGIGSNELVVDVLIAKYEMHLPLYRQEVQIARESGVELSRQTLCDWVMQCGFLLEAVSREMQSDLLQGPYIQADETPIGVRCSDKPGKNHRGYLWQVSRPGGPVVFEYRDSRGREGPARMLKGFGGVLQSDGYAAYAHPSIGAPGMVHSACMAHARRKFHDAFLLDPKNPALQDILARMAKLYAVEAIARERALDPQERLQLRQEHSVAIMANLREAILTLRAASLPKSTEGKAATYTLNLWKALSVFLDNGLVEIDSNLAENAMRPLVIGRKNWLHFGSKAAGPRIAAILSVAETCHRLGINFREYLLDVLPKLANGSNRQVPALTPAVWASR